MHILTSEKKKEKKIWVSNTIKEPSFKNMALNKQMHPRNPFKNNKPNFKELASKYEEFRKHATIDLKGRVHLDFKKPECLRALSWALLKDLYGLDVEMPLDRLVPTIPLRLNYILWLEDLLGPGAPIRGIDLGTGASCVYPLIAASKNKWSFTATEADATNWEYANRNVVKNNLQDSISVIKVSSEDSLLSAFSHQDETYDFCMCNPPFYGSNLEAWGLSTSRSENRPEPKSCSTASPSESVCSGGEVEFVRHMISDSHELKEKVRIYTSMLGKKSSLTILKEDLKRTGVLNMTTTEFCQGRTMRWGLAWSFDPKVDLTKAVNHHHKPRPPLLHTVSREQTERCGLEYNVGSLAHWVQGLLTQLKFEISEEINLNTKKAWHILARENTWSHQRRKRRQKQQAQTEGRGLTGEKQMENKGLKGGNQAESKGLTMENQSDSEGLTKENQSKSKRLTMEKQSESKGLTRENQSDSEGLTRENQEDNTGDKGLATDHDTEEKDSNAESSGSTFKTDLKMEECDKDHLKSSGKRPNTDDVETSDAKRFKPDETVGTERGDVVSDVSDVVNSDKNMKPEELVQGIKETIDETEDNKNGSENVHELNSKPVKAKAEIKEIHDDLSHSKPIAEIQDAGNTTEAMDVCETKCEPNDLICESSKKSEANDDHTVKICETKKESETNNAGNPNRPEKINHAMAETSSTSSLVLLSCRLSVYLEAESVVMAMEWIDGQSKESMHQVMQYFKNSLCKKTG